ncbi:MAG TPA: STAS domain-containing protein [Acidimicrobiia bacterium]|nr:STAS domain-containing protein [Acidimicrobiia bacterium]
MIQDEKVQLQLVQVPIELWKQARAHQDAVRREMDLLRASAPADSVPHRLMSLVEDFDARFGDINDRTWGDFTAAAEGGAEMTDLTIEMPLPAVGAARAMAAMMTEVDEFCRAGDHLMTLATPPELVALREWVLGELTRQIEQDADPLPWPDHVSRSGRPAHVAADSASARAGSETIVFEGSLDLASVGELRDAIQERRSRGPGQIVVDLTGVGFVDSIGIGLLITTHTRLEEEGVELRLIVSPRLKGLLELSGLTDLLRPEDPPAG